MSQWDTGAPERPLTPDEESDLSPGVRQLVVDLRAAGFWTTDSGDGSNFAAGMEHAEPFRHVWILVRPEDATSELERLRAFMSTRDDGCEWSVGAMGPGPRGVDTLYVEDDCEARS